MLLMHAGKVTLRQASFDQNPKVAKGLVSLGYFSTYPLQPFNGMAVAPCWIVQSI